MSFQLVDQTVTGFHQFNSHLRDFIYEKSRQCFARGDVARDSLMDQSAVRQRQQDIREFFLKSLGGLPDLDAPLEAKTTRVMDYPGFRVENVIFQSRPHHYVTANLYLPTPSFSPTAAVLFLCGHSIAGKAHIPYVEVCQKLALAGMVVLAQDPVGQGERLSYFDAQTGKATIRGCTGEHDYAGVQCQILGDNIARYFLHDAMRGIDYLVSRPEVDSARIGVTGNSGGGTQCSLLMMTDPRVAAAAPGTFIMSRDSYQRSGQAQDAEQIWPGFTAAGFDHEDILLSMVPKPVRVLAVTSDFFPIEGTRRTVQRSRRIWELFGKSCHLDLVEDSSLHGFTAPLADAAVEFFSKHLLGKPAPSSSLVITKINGEDLVCTQSGQISSDMESARFVFHANLERAEQMTAARMELSPAERNERAVAWLKKQIFRDRDECDHNLRLVPVDSFEDWEVTGAFWWSQPGLANSAQLIRRLDDRSRPLPVTVALWDGGTESIRSHLAWLRKECSAGRAVLVVNLCGMGPLLPSPINPRPMHHFYGVFHKLSDDLVWMGDSLAALRTFEFLHAIKGLALWPAVDSAGLRVYAAGKSGVYAKLASPFLPAGATMQWDQGFLFREIVASRFYDAFDIKSLILPGALRYFDLDEI